MSEATKPETKLPKGVSTDRDRHGNVRYYFRRTGAAKVRLKETPGTKLFEQEVAAARLGIPWTKPDAKTPSNPVQPPAIKDSLRWLLGEYKRRARGTVSVDLMERRVRMLEEICESRKGGKESARKRGELPYRLMEKRHVTEIRDELRATTGARNNVIKALSAMFAWAIENDLATNNPCSGIKRQKSGDGFHTWTIEEVRQFEQKYPLGSKARLALHIALFTGLRRSDLILVGRQHLQNGWISLRPGKTARSSNVVVEIPLLPWLSDTIAASPTGDLTWLVNDYGRPFTDDGFGNRFRKWCDDAGLPHCTVHGLRKAGATIAAENGATDDQLMAIFGWTTKQQTTLYTAKANRRRLAEAGMKHMTLERNADKIVPPPSESEKSGAKTAKKR
ncbi:integrase [Mycoplana sp. BE70]|uniref:tyrosine-type recombinase/integrase n=1 Tax=Mycoplana sp. BE70 TaxID=2817775 RepID=UPI00285DB25A|nr:tyrosine-type recombinase/integrase [Mycoplana sp. BE70]MDR6757802.1 integrase [Mycoplana sp. BE70]